MKKIKILSILSIFGVLISGCSCNKVSDETYANAVNIYETTDAIEFTRIETITTEGIDTYTRVKIEAKYTFNINKEVMEMEYSRNEADITSAGNNISDKTTKYYYDGNARVLYTHLPNVVGGEKVKETNVTYEEKFNVNVSQGYELLMIKGSFAPIFKLNEATDFVIDDQDGGAVVRLLAVCPNFENCKDSSEEIIYKYVIGKSGTIDSLSYEIENDGVVRKVNYKFHNYGSNNVKIITPNDLVGYKEK